MAIDTTTGMPRYGVEVEGVSKTFGGNVAAVRDVTLRIEEGSFVSLLGPSGCGKTTTLRMIAGLETPDAGRIRIHGETVFADGGATNLPPARRRVGFVFQSYALWPHMTVAENLGYPLARAGLDRASIRDKVGATLAMLKAPQLAQRYPGELSGGQQQRVALGRALIHSDNRVILFDEPLSNLDAKLREDLRMELRALQEDLRFTAIYVTHDQAEALSMSDRVVVMRDGGIEREGDPESVFHEPGSRYVAEFFGAHNLVAATLREVRDDVAILDSAVGPLRASAGDAAGLAAGSTVTAAVPADAFSLAPARAAGDGFEARVVGVAYYGTHYDVGIEIDGCRLRCRVPQTQRLRRGDAVHGQIRAMALILRR